MPKLSSKRNCEINSVNRLDRPIFSVSKLTWVWKGSDGYVNTWNDDVIDLCVDGNSVDGGGRQTDDAYSAKNTFTYLLLLFVMFVMSSRSFMLLCFYKTVDGVMYSYWFVCCLSVCLSVWQPYCWRIDRSKANRSWTGYKHTLICSCDLDLDPLTLLYEYDPDILKM